MKHPFVKQHDEKDCGAACLSMISEYYGLKLPLARYRELISVDNQGANIYGILRGAEQIGFTCDALTGEKEELEEGISSGEIKFPFIARIHSPLGYLHFIVVYGQKKDKFIISDPAKSGSFKLPKKAFYELWLGQIVVFEPGKDFVKRDETKGSFRKFFRLVTVQKKMLAFVLVASIIVASINIFSSVLFQYVLTASDSSFSEAAESYAEEYDHESEEDHDEEHEHDHDHEHEHEMQLNPLDYNAEEKYGQTAALIEKASSKLEVVFRNIGTVSISVIFLYIVSCLLNILRGFLLSMTAKRVDIPLTMQYYSKTIDMPSKIFSMLKTGELMSRFNDAANIRNAVSTATLTIMLDSVMSIACGALLYYISPKLFLITVIILALYCGVVMLFRRPIKTVNHEIMESSADVTSYLKETIDGIETIKLNQSEDLAKDNTYRLYNKYADLAVKGSVIYAIQEALVSAISSIGIVVLLWVGTKLCLNGHISITDLFVYYYLIGYFFNPVKNLINIQPEIQTAVAAADRLNDILCAEPENLTAGTESIEQIDEVCLKNVCFQYGTRQPVLKDISLSIPKGKKVALVGESGCGKTTIARLLTRFYSPTSGTITINGKDIMDYPINEVRRKIAYISQDVHIFADTVLNNLTMRDESITREEAERVCRMCSAYDFISELPGGFDCVLEENGGNLSAGQKQRLAIVRALLRKPDLLILDEATSNLDTVTENSIEAALENACKDISCLIIAHRLRTIRNCDYIYVLDDKKVIEEGDHDSLLNNGRHYKELYAI